MFEKIFTLLMLASLAQCVCHYATRAHNHTSVICTDHETGVPFEFIDVRDEHPLPKNSDEAPAMLARVYADYIKHAGNATKTKRVQTALDKRTLTIAFQDCGVKVEGYCADDHAVDWGSSLVVFKEILEAMMGLTFGRRLQRDPTAMCERIATGRGLMCLSWVEKQFADYTQQQIETMATLIAEGCQQRGDSAEAKFRNGRHTTVPQYFCVSNRSTGCRVNCAINACDNIPDAVNCRVAPQPTQIGP